VLFERRLREGIQDGSVTLAFRRWRRCQVVAGHRYRTGLKLRIRRLKELGLTISLDIGYRLSPRGEAYLRAAVRTAPHPTATP
jgi:hypothetical protein